MRLFDFLVYYPVASFKKRRIEEFTWGGPLYRATLLASITTSFFLFAILEIICWLIFHINILDVPYTIFLLLLGCFLIDRLFNYIYKTRKRYEYITSSSYRPFSVGVTLGTVICFFLFMSSIFVAVGVALLFFNLLKK
jgi:hypothetical protein